MLGGGEVPAGAHLIRVRLRPNCFICRSPGEIVYEGLHDALFGVQGTWSFRRCSNLNCRLLWLDPQPIEEDVGKAYVRYFTHEGPAAQPTMPQRVYRHVRASYLRSRFGYERATSGRGWRWFAPIANLHAGSGDVFAAAVMFLRAPKPGSSLLDIGCGGGDFMVRMRDLGWKVAGVETDPIAVER